MKDKRTVIMLLVAEPTVMDAAKEEAIRKKIFDEVVVPFKCEEQIHRGPSKIFKHASTYFIFKEGRLKNSIKAELKKTLDGMKKYWAQLIDYEIETVGEKD